MYSLPLFVSYPRTGAHWINCVMELYFDRPRLREGRVTFLEISRDDWMWFHDHDLELKIKHGDVLYMYREPIATIYSNIIYQYFDDRKLSLPFKLIQWNKVFHEDNVICIAKKYRDHLEKWLLSDSKATTVVCHDRFKKDRDNEFKKICDFFSFELNEKRLKWSFSQVTKEELVKRVQQKAPMGGHILQKSYANKRNYFQEVWGDTIRQIVFTPDLKPYFS